LKNLLNVMLSAAGNGGKTMLVPIGEFDHPRGLQVVDAAAAQRIADDLKNREQDIVIDFGHESFSSPRAEAAGWLKPETVEVQNDGVYAVIDWTDEAAEKIKAKKFRYLSPVLEFNPVKSKNGRFYIVKITTVRLRRGRIHIIT